MFHAEVGGPIEEACKHIEEQKAQHQDLQSKYQTFLNSRPRKAENEAISLIIRLCREYRVR